MTEVAALTKRVTKSILLWQYETQPKILQLPIKKGLYYLKTVFKSQIKKKGQRLQDAKIKVGGANTRVHQHKSFKADQKLPDAGVTQVYFTRNNPSHRITTELPVNCLNLLLKLPNYYGGRYYKLMHVTVLGLER